MTNEQMLELARNLRARRIMCNGGNGNVYDIADEECEQAAEILESLAQRAQCTWPNCDQPSGHDYCYSHCFVDDSPTVPRPAIQPQRMPVDPTRCEVCDWPFAESRERGCVPGDCCYRPDTPAEQERIRKRRAALALTRSECGESE